MHTFKLVVFNHESIKQWRRQETPSVPCWCLEMKLRNTISTRADQFHTGVTEWVELWPLTLLAHPDNTQRARPGCQGDVTPLFQTGSHFRARVSGFTVSLIALREKVGLTWECDNTRFSGIPLGRKCLEEGWGVVPLSLLLCVWVCVCVL